jgi:hypothetical protein
MAKLHSRFVLASLLWTFVVPFVTTWVVLLVFRRINPISGSFIHKLVYGWSWIFYPIAMILHELFSSAVSSHNRKLHMKRLGCHNLIPKVKVRQPRYASFCDTYAKALCQGSIDWELGCSSCYCWVYVSNCIRIFWNKPFSRLAMRQMSIVVTSSIN